MQESTDNNLKALRTALESGRMRPLHTLLGSMHPAEIARLLESLPPTQRYLIWGLVAHEDEGEILVEVADEVRNGLIENMPTAELIAATEGMELDDLADLVADLPEAITQQVIRSLDQQDRERLETVLGYPEDSAGGLMNPDTITVRPNVTLEVVLRYLRQHGEVADKTDSVFVVSRDGKLTGSLYLSRLLTWDPELSVAEVMDAECVRISTDTSAEKVAQIFEDRDLLSAAVVDDAGRLVGRITVDDVVDVIRESAEHAMMGAAGLDEEDDMFAPVLISARRRAIWLGVNLATAFLAAAVVDTFRSTIDQVVLLAVLMPVVPSMGGVAGTQSLTIITRAIALDQIDKGNAKTILRKELSVGLLNGCAWAILVSIVTMLWFDTWKIGAVIAAALAINLVVAAAAGFFVPLVLRRLNQDPAIAGGVVLTTITDVIGYGVFLGLGALILL